MSGTTSLLTISPKESKHAGNLTDVLNYLFSSFNDKDPYGAFISSDHNQQEGIGVITVVAPLKFRSLIESEDELRVFTKTLMYRYDGFDWKLTDKQLTREVT